MLKGEPIKTLDSIIKIEKVKANISGRMDEVLSGMMYDINLLNEAEMNLLEFLEDDINSSVTLYYHNKNNRALKESQQ